MCRPLKGNTFTFTADKCNYKILWSATVTICPKKNHINTICKLYLAKFFVFIILHYKAIVLGMKNPETMNFAVGNVTIKSLSNYWVLKLTQN